MRCSAQIRSIGITQDGKLVGPFCRTIMFVPIILLFTIVGCAGTQQASKQLSNLQLQISEIQKTQTDIYFRMEELNNKIFLVQDKIDTNAKEIQDLNKDVNGLKSAALLTVPPEELKILKIPPPTLQENEDKIGKVERNLIEKPLGEKAEKGDIPSKELVRKGIDTIRRGEAPEDIYRSAFTLFEKGDLSEALEAFTTLLQKFPEHLLSDNAQYWIGEIYYTQRNFFMALTEFSKVLDNYPRGNKAPDALFKVALSYSELGDRETYLKTLKRLLATYPTSKAALRAKDRLD